MHPAPQENPVPSRALRSEGGAARQRTAAGTKWKRHLAPVGIAETNVTGIRSAAAMPMGERGGITMKRVIVGIVGTLFLAVGTSVVALGWPPPLCQ